MQIATISSVRRGEVDLLLESIAIRLLSEGFRPVGAVRVNPAGRAGGHCDTDLRVLPDGPVIRISQDLGAHSTACRLDAAAIEDAVGRVEAALDGPADLLILNKFGFRESEGRGFRSCIARALEREIPVLLGLPDAFRESFEAFAKDLSESLPADEGAVLAWCRR